MAKTKTKKVNLSTILLFVGGLLLLVKFIIDGGIPSPSADVFQFIVGLFIALVIIAFYFIFLFGVKNQSLFVRAFAPAVLILILFGKGNIKFINGTVTGIFNIINNLAYLLMILTGFVLLFLKNKIIGYVFTFSSFTSALIILSSLTTVAIYDAVQGKAFNANNLIVGTILTAALCLLASAILLLSRNKKLLDI